LLDDINGVSLFYNAETGYTFLNLINSIKNYGKDGKRFDSQIEKGTGGWNPTYVTEIDQKLFKKVRKQHKEVQEAGVDSTNLNNLIPVEIMRDGQMGVTLASLSLVIHKIFNQIYGLTDRVNKGVQTQEIVFSTRTVTNKLNFLIKSIRKPANMGNRSGRKSGHSTYFNPKGDIPQGYEDYISVSADHQRRRLSVKSAKLHPLTNI